MASRAALVMSAIALVLTVAGWSAGIALWRSLPPAPAATPALSREWGQGVVWVLRDYDKRLTTLEREILLHTDAGTKP